MSTYTTKQLADLMQDKCIFNGTRDGITCITHRELTDKPPRCQYCQAALELRKLAKLRKAIKDIFTL